ncbi:Cyanophycinase [Natranaerofaba carboxydovora]|nr:cyanophycinase [Natranaerofaba carboxydovora]UMZ75262.1 Cyanophycinase [Natranaerofaba carboxydovora]
MSKGRLFIIGGNENKGEKSILKDFVRLSGGSNACIGVIPTATKDPEETGERYKEVFKNFGAEDVHVLNIQTRKDGDKKALINLFDDITGVYFTGGDQLRITSIIGGTEFDKKLHEYHRKGLVVGGTSAGASVMSDTMIVEGLDESPPAKSTVNMAPGLGFLQRTVIDQHFDQRGRMGRLLTVVAQNPHVLGFGIDEDTAIVTEDETMLKVLGTQTVTVVDGSKIDHSNIIKEGEDQPLAITNIIIHVLSAGYFFDLKRRHVKGGLEFESSR